MAAAITSLPQLTQSSGVASLVPASSPAVQTEVTATRIFGAPLDAPVVVVQRAARGLSSSAQADAIRNAVNIDTGQAGGSPIAGLAGALPIPNTDGAFPGSRERSTTVLTFLYFRPGASVADAVGRRRAVRQPLRLGPGRPPGGRDRGRARHLRARRHHQPAPGLGGDRDGAGHLPDRRVLLPLARSAAGDAGLRRHGVPARRPGRRLGYAADARHAAARCRARPGRAAARRHHRLLGVLHVGHAEPAGRRPAALWLPHA